jgi:hypothetical protein
MVRFDTSHHGKINCHSHHNLHLKTFACGPHERIRDRVPLKNSNDVGGWEVKVINSSTVLHYYSNNRGKKKTLLRKQNKKSLS